MIISYYNENKELIFVDHHFLKEGVRIQRKQYFSYDLLNLRPWKVMNLNEKNFYVNGLSNESFASKVKMYRTQEYLDKNLIKADGKGFSYLSFELNNYVGNPK